jgi:hypothetical protein
VLLKPPDDALEAIHPAIRPAHHEHQVKLVRYLTISTSRPSMEDREDHLGLAGGTGGPAPHAEGEVTIAVDLKKGERSSSWSMYQRVGRRRRRRER